LIADSFFIPKFVKDNNNWNNNYFIFKEKDLKVIEHFLIPYNIPNSHWILILVNLKDRKLTIYDSLENTRVGRHKNVTTNIVKYLKHKFPGYFDGKWTEEYPKNIPFQPNGSCCGIYTSMYALYFCLNKKFDFNHDDTKLFRSASSSILLELRRSSDVI
jgi:Ulp1 family protease